MSAKESVFSGGQSQPSPLKNAIRGGLGFGVGGLILYLGLSYLPVPEYLQILLYPLSGLVAGAILGSRKAMLGFAIGFMALWWKFPEGMPLPLVIGFLVTGVVGAAITSLELPKSFPRYKVVDSGAVGFLLGSIAGEILAKSLGALFQESQSIDLVGAFRLVVPCIVGGAIFGGVRAKLQADTVLDEDIEEEEGEPAAEHHLAEEEAERIEEQPEPSSELEPATDAEEISRGPLIEEAQGVDDSPPPRIDMEPDLIRQNVPPDYHNALLFSLSEPDEPGIYRMDSDGSNLIRLTDGINDHAPAWSPDGRTIAYLSAVPENAEEDSSYQSAFHYRIHIMDPDGSNLTALTSAPATAFCWSPNGRLIAFQTSTVVRTGLSSSIFVIDANGRDERRVTRIRGVDHSPTFSPDGSALAFVSDRRITRDQNGERVQGRWRVFLMDVAGHGQQMLCREPEDLDQQHPLWSPDGSKIIFTACDAEAFDTTSIICLVAADGRKLTTLATDEMPQRHLQWTPDGKGILASIAGKTCLVDADSRRIVRQATGPIVNPRLSADGKKLAFTAHRKGSWSIYSMAVEAGQPEKLTADLANKVDFAWSPR